MNFFWVVLQAIINSFKRALLEDIKRQILIKYKTIRLHRCYINQIMKVEKDLLGFLK